MLSKKIIISVLIGTLALEDVSAVKLQQPVLAAVQAKDVSSADEKAKAKQEDVAKSVEQIVSIQKQFDAYKPELIAKVEADMKAKKEEEEAAKKAEEEKKQAEDLKKGEFKNLKVEEVKTVAKKEVLQKAGAKTGDPHVSIGGKDPREELQQNTYWRERILNISPGSNPYQGAKPVYTPYTPPAQLDKAAAARKATEERNKANAATDEKKSEKAPAPEKKSETKEETKAKPEAKEETKYDSDVKTDSDKEEEKKDVEDKAERKRKEDILEADKKKISEEVKKDAESGETDKAIEKMTKAADAKKGLHEPTIPDQEAEKGASLAVLRTDKSISEKAFIAASQESSLDSIANKAMHFVQVGSIGHGQSFNHNA